MKKIEITNYDELREDIERLLQRTSLTSGEDRAWFAKVYTRAVIREKHFRPAEEVPADSDDELPVRYVQSELLRKQANYILDWLSELKERNPQLYGKLPRINFQQAYQHSERWHAAMAKAADKSDRYVEPDQKNAPKVLDLGDGWEVFWLKTDLARDIEGEIMGHCVGNGAYDNLGSGRAVLSVRKNNVAHITIDLKSISIMQAVTKGNGEVPERYRHLVDQAAAVLGVRLLMARRPDDQRPIEDGEHIIEDGTRIYTRNAVLHRDDGPAIIHPDGDETWYQKGAKHREDGPAEIKGEVQTWYRHGVRHRDDGPAKIEVGVRESWYRNDKLHRVDGPAFISIDGTQHWYLHGQRHREDGPAVMDPHKKTWWQNGKHYRPDGGPTHEFADGTLHWTNAEGQLHREDGPAVIFPDGTEHWYLDGKHYRPDGGPTHEFADGTLHWTNAEGQLHREDGPAAIFPDGTEHWYLDGNMHREDGPAVTRPNGSEEWYRHGRLHREDGPAVISHGVQHWYYEGKVHRKDGPAILWPDGREEWLQMGEFHREGGPARTSPNGAQHWYHNGSRHRTDGPAIIEADGKQTWYFDGVVYSGAELEKAIEEGLFEPSEEFIKELKRPQPVAI